MDMKSKQSLGGTARAEKLTQKQRQDIARKASLTRWNKESVGLQFPSSPFAKHKGFISLGGKNVECYVLDNGKRVLGLGKTVELIANVETSDLGSYLRANSLKNHIDKNEILSQTIEFNIPGLRQKGRGIGAESFIEVCQAYVKAFEAGDLKTDKQKENAMRCAILLSSCAKVGLISLIDEATGHQYERASDALQVKLMAYINEELRAWEKTFPDDLWEEFGRLTNWKTPLKSRPRWWGKLVTELIYDTLDKDVSNYLKKNKPKQGIKWHQQLTENVGVRQLVSRCYEVIGIAKTCHNIGELREKVGSLYNREYIQMTMYFDKK
jgi:hypothetical protein